MTQTWYKSKIVLKNDTPYLALLGGLWGVHCEDCFQKIGRVITALHCRLTKSIYIYFINASLWSGGVMLTAHVAWESIQNHVRKFHSHGLVQDCSNSSALPTSINDLIVSSAKDQPICSGLDVLISLWLLTHRRQVTHICFSKLGHHWFV